MGMITKNTLITAYQVHADIRTIFTKKSCVDKNDEIMPIS